MNNSKRIILFDGMCNLCSNSVHFIIKRDTQQKFQFASLQGQKGKELLKKFNLPAEQLHSFVLIEEESVYTRSAGALRVLKELGGVWKLLYAFIIIPPFIRDAVYNLIASNRYNWFGKKDECWLPTPALKKRFLD